MDKTRKKLLSYLENNRGKLNDYTASDLSEVLEISRNNISHHLNRLVEEGILDKTNTRPTRFMYRESKEENQAFEGFIGYHTSLKNSIEKCKAAVNYPNGLPIMIRGESGTGKSYLAKLIFQYSKDNRVIKQDAPFIILNCADYANNPELLSSVLFGHVKGAFTGADSEKVGLIDEAKDGYLFLDEVHNLSAENQEKLFLLIDSQKFRRLGDNEQWQDSNIRLIMATTEDIQSNLLTTFRRRIPLSITLPAFNQRPIVERHRLVMSIFQEEAEKVKKTIHVSLEVIKDLESEYYEGNIGELKNEIKLLVAKHYAQAEITLEKRGACNQRFHEFEAKTNVSYEFQEWSGQIEMKKHQSIEKYGELVQVVDNLMYAITYGLKNHYGSYEIFLENEFDKNQIEWTQYRLEKLLREKGIVLENEDFRSLLETILFFYRFDYSYEMAIELTEKERMKSHKYIRLSKGLIEELLPYTLEPDKITLFLAAFFERQKTIFSDIPAVIVMHGENNATSIVSMANQLVGDYVYDGFDMSLETSSTELIEEILDYIKQIDTKNGLLIFVDMGSLEEIYEKITPFVEGDLLVMNNVTSAIALDVAMRLKSGVPMKELIKIDTNKYTVEKRYFEGLSQKKNILVTCLSGEGIAAKVKEILSHYFNQENVEILTMDFKNIQQYLKQSDLSIFKNTLAIVTTPSIEDKRVPIVNIEEIVNGLETLERFSDEISVVNRKECINEIIKLFTIEGATAKLTFLNPEKIVNEVEEVIKAYEDFYKIEIQNFIRINLFLHLSSMIERLLIHDEVDVELSPDILLHKEKFEDFLGFSKIVFSKIRKKYNIEIPDSEFGMVFQLINELISTRM